MANKGTGMAITFDSSYFAAMTGGDWTGISKAIEDVTTCATTGGKEFEASDLYDPGEINVEFLFAAEVTPQVLDSASSGNCTVTFSDTGAAGWAMQAIFANLDISWGNVDERVRGSATLKLSGDIVITP